MKPEFSEFTYGYALIEELSRELGFSGVPTFPSLIQEGKEGGYDVEIEVGDVPYFLQFKLSHFLKRTNSKYHHEFKGSYYRFDLRALKKSKQHILLQALEATGPQVYYVAPKFHDERSLNKHYANSNISFESIWLEPSEIGDLPDDKEHCVCFNYNATNVRRFSLTKIIEYRSPESRDNMRDYLEQRYRYRGFLSKEWSWEYLYNEMVKIMQTYDPMAWSILSEREDDERDVVVKVSRLALLGFGSFLVIRKRLISQ